MLKIIRREFKWMYNNSSLVKSLYNYYMDNSFRVQCNIKRIQRIKNPIRRAFAIRKLEKKYTFRLGLFCSIGEELYIHHHNGTIIGERAIIGNHCEIYQQVTIGSKNNKYPTIGNNVVLYPGCKIVGEISIGDNAIIAPNTVVIHDVPANAVVSGIPAKVIKWR